MKNIRQPPMIHHCNQTVYIQRGANLVQMAAAEKNLQKAQAQRRLSEKS